MEKKRPIGVTIFGILFLLGGIRSLPDLLMRSLTYFRIAKQIAISELTYNIIVCISLIISGLGLLCMKKWARYLIISLTVIFIYTGIIDIRNINILSPQEQAEKLYGIFSYIVIVFNILVFCYFIRPKIKQQFQ